MLQAMIFIPESMTGPLCTIVVTIIAQVATLKRPSCFDITSFILS